MWFTAESGHASVVVRGSAAAVLGSVHTREEGVSLRRGQRLSEHFVMPSWALHAAR